MQIIALQCKVLESFVPMYCMKIKINVKVVIRNARGKRLPDYKVDQQIWKILWNIVKHRSKKY